MLIGRNSKFHFHRKYLRSIASSLVLVYVANLINFFPIFSPHAEARINEQSPSLSQEQIFLYSVHKHLNELSPLDWDWELDSPGRKHRLWKDFRWGTHKADIEFTLKTHPHDSSQWLLYAHDKQGQPRYGRMGSEVPIAIYISTLGQWKWNLTGSNVWQVFEYFHQNYIDDVNETFDQIGASTVGYVGNKESPTAFLPSFVMFGARSGNPRSSYAQIDQASIDVDALIKHAHAVGLQQAAMSYADDRIGFGKVQSSARIKKELHSLRPSMSLLSSMSSKKSPSMFVMDQVVDAYTQGSIQPLNVAKEVSIFNTHVKAIQEICKKAKVEKETQQASAGLSPTPYYQDQSYKSAMSPDTRKQGFNTYKQILDDEERLVRAGAESYLTHLREQSGLRRLWASKKFEAAAGSFTAKGCVTNGQNVDLHPISEQIVNEAHQEVYGYITQALNQSIDIVEKEPGYFNKSSQIKNAENEIRRILTSSPEWLRAAIISRGDVTEAAWIAQELRILANMDQSQRYLAPTMFGVSVIAAAITFGGSVALGELIALLSTATTTYKLGIDPIYRGYKLRPEIRKQMAANQISMGLGRRKLKTLDRQLPGQIIITATGLASATLSIFNLTNALQSRGIFIEKLPPMKGSSNPNSIVQLEDLSPTKPMGNTPIPKVSQRGIPIQGKDPWKYTPDFENLSGKIDPNDILPPGGGNGAQSNIELSPTKVSGGGKLLPSKSLKKEIQNKPIVKVGNEPGRTPAKNSSTFLNSLTRFLTGANPFASSQTQIKEFEAPQKINNQEAEERHEFEPLEKNMAFYTADQKLLMTLKSLNPNSDEGKRELCKASRNFSNTKSQAYAAEVIRQKSITCPLDVIDGFSVYTLKLKGSGINEGDIGEVFRFFEQFKIKSILDLVSTRTEKNSDGSFYFVKIEWGQRGQGELRKKFSKKTFDIFQELLKEVDPRLSLMDFPAKNSFVNTKENSVSSNHFVGQESDNNAKTPKFGLEILGFPGFFNQWGNQQTPPRNE